RLLPHKAALEQHLRQRLGELFALEYDLLLYDVTSTYFEGLALRNALAARGYSRDHRPDCTQVCIALVVTRGGIPLGYARCAGSGGAETVVLCRSVERREKAKAMYARVAQRIETGLQALAGRLARARKPLDRGKLERQIGRLLERNTRAAGRYTIDLVDDRTRPAGLALQWSARAEWDEWARQSEGCYVLRTNIADWDVATLWRTYVQLTDAEAAFRI